MTRISIVVLVLTATVLASGQMNKKRQREPPLSGFASGDIKDRIRVQPAPMPGFNVNAWLGPWIHQFHKPPCSWAISSDFTDYAQFLERQGNLILTHDTHRNRNICNKLTSALILTGPGQFSVKDLGGDNWSGIAIIVATDYRRFAISWGCTKWSTFDQICDDPWVNVKTRQLKVSIDVVRQVNSILQNVFGISVSELTRIRQGNQCPRGGKKQV